MAVLDTALGRIVAPTGAVGFALFAEERGWGLFNLAALPAWWAKGPCGLPAGNAQNPLEDG